MATDIFSRTVNYGGAFSADGVTIAFAGFGAGMLVQKITYSYQQAITRLYEVGSADLYLVAGRTQGQSQLARVLGPSAILASFYTTYGDVCNAAGNIIEFSANVGCGTEDVGDTIAITMHHCVINQLGVSISAQDMIINESLAMIFLYLTMGGAAE